MHLQQLEGYHLLIKDTFETSIFSVKNSIYKGKGLDLGAELPRVKVFSVPSSCLSLASFSLSLSKTVFYLLLNGKWQFLYVEKSHSPSTN